ncbi:MAG TPA: hypothetical protein VIX73_38335, partial [Kofleriaceae bacterium]
LRLAVAAPGPGGWALPVSLPIALVARPAAGVRTIAIDRTTTVDSLAATLAQLAALDAPSAALVPAKP